MMGPVAAGGSVGVGPGLVGGINATVDCVSYTAGVIVKYNNPRRPLPRCD